MKPSKDPSNPDMDQVNIKNHQTIVKNKKKYLRPDIRYLGPIEMTASGCEDDNGGKTSLSDPRICDAGHYFS